MSANTIDLTDLPHGRLIGRFLAYNGRTYNAADIQVKVARTAVYSYTTDTDTGEVFTLFTEPALYRVDSNGYLISDSAHQGAIVPVGNYTVTVLLHGETLRDETGPVASFITVTDGAIIDLTNHTAFPEPPEPAFQVTAAVYNAVLQAATDTAAGIAEIRQLIADGAAGPAGQDGADGASAYELAVADGFEGTLVDWLLSLKGQPGTDGRDGRDGLDGAPSITPGPAGQDGQDGEPGQPGRDGAGVDEVHVNLLAAGSEPSATLVDGTLTLSLPEAEPGAQGQDGEAGQDGADGASAYELAVADGFEGTVEEWLDSLQAALVSLADAYKEQWAQAKAYGPSYDFSNGIPTSWTMTYPNQVQIIDASSLYNVSGAPNSGKVLRVKAINTSQHISDVVIPVRMGAGGGAMLINYVNGGQGGGDYAYILLDGAVVDYTTSTAFKQFTLNIGAGDHTVTLRYNKDQNYDWGRQPDAAFFGLLSLTNGNMDLTGSLQVAGGYTRGDLVLYMASLYVSLADNNMAVPTDTANWRKIVQGVDPTVHVLGLPAGGSAGQQLTKQSTTDGDAAWVTPKKRTMRTTSGFATGLGPGGTDAYSLQDGTNPDFNTGSQTLLCAIVGLTISGSGGALRLRIYGDNTIYGADLPRPFGTPIPAVGGPIVDIMVPNGGGAFLPLTPAPLGKFQSFYAYVDNPSSTVGAISLTSISYIQMEDK